MMAKVKLLIVEDNVEFCDILQSYFGLCDDIFVCGIAHNGEDALIMIAEDEPDVVLLDIIMPKLDGISVLERLQSLSLPKAPRIIVESAIGLGNVTDHALSLGASYYMIKPYNLEDLRQRVLMMAPDEEPSFSFSLEKFTQNRIKDAVEELGIPINILGYAYIIEAVELILSAGSPCSLTKQVYPLIAKRNNTTADCVESAIRKTIERIYIRRSASLFEMMGRSVENRRPSNGYFLTTLAEKMKADYALKMKDK